MFCRVMAGLWAIRLVDHDRLVIELGENVPTRRRPMRELGFVRFEVQSHLSSSSRFLSFESRVRATLTKDRCSLRNRQRPRELRAPRGNPSSFGSIAKKGFHGFLGRARRSEPAASMKWQTSAG